MSNPAPTIPTLSELEARFYARIDAELEHYAGKIAKRAFRAAFHDVLAGDVALLSRADRRQAFYLVKAGQLAESNHMDDLASERFTAARRLLQLGTEEK